MRAAASLALDDVAVEFDVFFPRIELDRARAGGGGQGGVALAAVVPVATIGFKMTGPLAAPVAAAGADFRFSRDDEGGGKAR